MASHTGNERSTERDQKRLRTAIRILDNWGLDQIGQAQILRVEPQLLSSRELVGALGIDHLARISFLLNIHVSLRELFQNPQNYYGYMAAVNYNPPFSGQSPSEFIRAGELASLKEVFEHLEFLKYGQQYQ
ncbi:hypothetical protein [Marinobacter alexandrii]|uniref:hypothetical protein n=1 Tax=Marinobacter alexandrii TaxID=2570351 RepID=UPI00110936A7|nr:hypothetical protein [Marinobacter alexandrii]